MTHADPRGTHESGVFVNFYSVVFVRGTAKFLGSSVNNGTINGKVVFKKRSRNGPDGVINGAVTTDGCLENNGVINGPITQNGECGALITISPIDWSTSFTGGLLYPDTITTWTVSATSDPPGLALSYEWQYSEDSGATWFDYANGRIDYYWPPPWINPDALPPTDAASADYYRIVSGAQTNTLVVRESWANVAYRQHNARRVIVSAPGAETASRTWKLWQGGNL